ncbi:MAG: site-specific DNA-methyltransferase [Deltaproteobacteria bacterium]|jgi:site-specific DNA-methyltransferase (adenine-specific)/modification methylase|nr:site-specific DNA-methyltransferase [Deltaproteobacteria bacterium]
MSDQDLILFQGDCHQYLADVPESSIDLILTDPPYNLSQYSTGNMQFAWRSEINNDLAAWDQQFDPAEVKDQFLRILKPTGNLFAFCSYNLLGRWHDVFDPLFDTFQFFVWHKSNPVPKIRKQGFLNSCELIVCMWNKGHTWNFGRQNEMHNFFEGPICMSPERLKDPKHPTQKPLRLLKHLIRIASQAGDTVLDPFMGVGSTGVAALALGRKFVGMELESTYFEAAQARLNATESKHRRASGPALIEKES